MFNKLVASEGKQKKNMTPGGIVVSIILHGLLIVGFIAIGVNAEGVAKKADEIVDFVDVEEEEKPKEEPPKPEEPPPPPPKVEEAPPVVKGTQELVPPEEPPARIPDVDPTQKAVNVADYSAEGKLGGVANGVENGVAQDVTNRETPPDQGTYEIDAVEEKPSISNSSEVQRALERNYPPLLRDAGITGTVTVRMRVNESGRVDAESITIENSSNEGFNDATKRAVERIRFRPAKVGGRAVKVWVTLPITWTIR